MDARIIEDGYSACAGLTENGWYGGVLLIPSEAPELLAPPVHDDWQQRAEHARRWSRRSIGRPRRIQLVTESDGAIHRRDLAAAEWIDGPVSPQETTDGPIVAWIERRGRQWHVMVHRDGQTRSIYARETTIRCPRAALVGDRLLVAFERDAGAQVTCVEIVDETGAIVYCWLGRRPLLCAAGDGYVLATEQAEADGVRLRLDHVPAASSSSTVELAEGDYLLNADIVWSDDAGALFVAAESCPRFGFGNQVGLHRTIHTWRWDLSSDPSPLGRLPVDERAFKSIGAENLPPIKPSVRIDGDRPVVLFKQHRYTGFRAFGWDIFRSRYDGEAWGAPERISPATTRSDSTFGLVQSADGWVGLFPAHENEGGSGSKMSTGNRLEVIHLDDHPCLERFEIPEDNRADYRTPASHHAIAPEPPTLPSPYEGRRLIWGDLHIHTIYSKCVAAVDGDPEENIRFVREVLGCRVFAIAEHTRHTTGPESTWLYDRLEGIAGDENVILYASEPGIDGMRHTNWYARDRETFEKLERIMISHGNRYHEILRQVREDIPADAVFVLRHFHGRAIPDEQIPQHFDPQFEVAMEAMQGRCNAMLDPREKSGVFPNTFLDAGCKIGLVGGTDHYREWCPNHFCLTGFWVKEVSREGVWEALRNRYTTAMSDARVALSTTCGDAPMGSSVELSRGDAFRVSLQAACARTIRRATLLRDGEPLPWIEVGATTANMELLDPSPAPGRHWYVPTVEVETAYDDHTGICHASPYFVMAKG